MKKKNFYLTIFLLLICTIKIIQIGYKRIHFSSDLLFNSFKKGFADNRAVSEDVLDAFKLISNHKISYFRLSDELMYNNYFRQRIVEFSYPVRLKKESKFLISNINEDFNCTMKSKSKKIKLYEC